MQHAGYASAVAIGECHEAGSIDCRGHEGLAPSPAFIALRRPRPRGAHASRERPGARDRGQGGPADSGVAVQLGGGDRAGGLVRRAVDAVAAAAAAGAAPRRLFRLPALFEWLASLVGVGLFALVLYSGFAGAQVPNANFSVTFIYVIFWVGMPLASVLFGDIFRAFNPWRTLCAGRSARSSARSARGRSRGPLLRYPHGSGCGRRSAVIAGFAWLELVYIPADREHPIDAGGAVAGLLPRDARRDGAVRRRAVGGVSRRLRGLLQSHLAAVGAVPGRGRRAVPAPSAQRRHGPRDTRRARWS